MRVVRENARRYNGPVMRWIWGGILLTTFVFNQHLVWGGGNGVERGPILWGNHARILSDEARELVEKEIQKVCPAAFAEADPEKPVIVTSMSGDYTDGAQKRRDRNPTERFMIGLKRETPMGDRAHNLAVMVETRKELSQTQEVRVLTKGPDCEDQQ